MGNTECTIADGPLNTAFGKANINKGYNSVIINDAKAIDDVGGLGINASELTYTRSCFATGTSQITGTDSENRIFYAAAIGAGCKVYGTGSIALGVNSTVYGRGNIALAGGQIASTDVISEFA
jgi:hypothetical protein